MKTKEKSLKTQMISNELVLSVMKPSVVLWSFPSIFIRNILRILPTLFAHSAPSTLGKDTFLERLNLTDGAITVGLNRTGHMSFLTGQDWT